jgi:hypothetical protein
MSIQVVPYQQTYDKEIKQLEDCIVQGNQIKLKIVKENFLGRSKVFNEKFPVLAVDDKNSAIGTSVGVITKMIVNDEEHPAGFVFDVKVHPAFHNRGIGKLMAGYQKQNFNTKGIAKNFTTLKRSNVPVLKLTAKAIGNTWLYDFVYLTIPSSVYIKPSSIDYHKQSFFVSLFNQTTLDIGYYTFCKGNLACFHTYKLYHLKIEKINWLYKAGIKILKTFQPTKYALLPKEKEEMEFVTLFNHTESNISHINDVLKEMSIQGKKFLLVCCRKNDAIYNYLKKYSINTYGYYILSDFLLKESDKVTIDVRCL